MKSEVWLTPPEILKALGPFDLDPCAPAVRPWDMAARHISLPECGLAAEWTGRVWCNPPFGRKAAAWLRKMAKHRNGIALIPARTETAMFYESVWGGGDAVCFLKGRPHFHRVDGTRAPFNSGAPICLVAYGSDNVEALERASLGVVVRWTNATAQTPPGFGTPEDPGEVCESEVTWCRDKIFAHDVEYVRADRVNILLQALHGLTMPCTRADYTVGKLDAVVCKIAQNAIDKYRHNKVITEPQEI